MNAEQILARMRKFLLLIAASVFLMTIVELLSLHHWDEIIQLLPFALSGLGLIAVALVYFRPGPKTVKLLRGSLIVIGLGSLIGIFVHLANNYGFQLEIQPNATAWERIIATLGGANPLLAPGILALGAVIGWISTYRHPALMRK